MAEITEKNQDNTLSLSGSDSNSEDQQRISRFVHRSPRCYTPRPHSHSHASSPHGYCRARNHFEEEREMIVDDTKTTVHHLWQCGEWTSSNEKIVVEYPNTNDMAYNSLYKARVVNINSCNNWFINTNPPQLTVIEPNSFQNVLLLSKVSCKRLSN